MEKLTVRKKFLRVIAKRKIIRPEYKRSKYSETTFSTDYNMWSTS